MPTAHRPSPTIQHRSPIIDGQHISSIMGGRGGGGSIAVGRPIIRHRSSSINGHRSSVSTIRLVLSIIIIDRSIFGRRSSIGDHQSSSTFDHRSLIIVRHRRRRSSITNHQLRSTNRRSSIIGHLSQAATDHRLSSSIIDEGLGSQLGAPIILSSNQRRRAMYVPIRHIVASVSRARYARFELVARAQ